MEPFVSLKYPEMTVPTTPISYRVGGGSSNVTTTVKSELERWKYLHFHQASQSKTSQNSSSHSNMQLHESKVPAWVPTDLKEKIKVTEISAKREKSTKNAEYISIFHKWKKKTFLGPKYFLPKVFIMQFKFFFLQLDCIFTNARL